MNGMMNTIVSQLTGAQSLEDCSEAQLEQLAHQYPSFATVHLFLAAKKKEKSPAAAALYFYHPLWAKLGLTAETAEDHFTGTALYEKSLEQAAFQAAVETPATEEPLVDQTTEPVVENTSSEHRLEEPFSAILETPATEEPLVDQTEEEDNGSEEEEATELPAFKIPLNLPTVEELKEKKPLEENTASSQLLSFEPFHTVDYFASQGMYYKDETISKDRFTVQLRSFTDWLKAMKKTDPETASQTTATEEKRVENMAAVSISPREIVTETMAEVWEKQGNKVKAIAIYQKLSLLDPAKNAYFAAKIEKLKHS